MREAAGGGAPGRGRCRGVSRYSGGAMSDGAAEAVAWLHASVRHALGRLAEGVGLDALCAQRQG